MSAVRLRRLVGFVKGIFSRSRCAQLRVPHTIVFRQLLSLRAGGATVIDRAQITINSAGLAEILYGGALRAEIY